MGKTNNKSAVAPVYNSDYLVVQANELIRAQQDELTLLEAKLTRFAISQILQADTDFKTFSIEVAKLAKYLKMPKGNIYREITDLTESLMKKVITITWESAEKNKPNYKKFHWVDTAEYKEGTLTLKLSNSLKPYLLGLNELFTQYPYTEVLELPTYYSMRLFELLTSYQNVKFRNNKKSSTKKIYAAADEIVFSIEQIKEFFKCDDKYKRQSNLISVIDRAVKAINTSTVMRVSYRTVKEERGKITYIVFKIGNIISQAIETTEGERADNGRK